MREFIFPAYPFDERLVRNAKLFASPPLCEETLVIVAGYVDAEPAPTAIGAAGAVVSLKAVRGDKRERLGQF
jgi:hypothetical protein